MVIPYVAVWCKVTTMVKWLQNMEVGWPRREVFMD